MRSEYHKIENQEKAEKEVLLTTKTPDSNFEIPMASPYGIFSNPKGEAALVLRDAESMVAIPLQKYVKLEEGDVMVTDGESKLHLQKQDGKIVITGDTVFENGVTIKGDLEVEGNVKVKGDISGDKTIKATGDIESTKNIKASGNIDANGKITGTDIEGTANVTAGPTKIGLVSHTHVVICPPTGGTVTSATGVG